MILFTFTSKSDQKLKIKVIKYQVSMSNRTPPFIREGDRTKKGVKDEELVVLDRNQSHFVPPGFGPMECSASVLTIK